MGRKLNENATVVLVMSGFLGTPLIAWADCEPSILNKSCALRLSRETPVSPLPVRVTSQGVVTLSMPKRPLDKIVFETTLVETVASDPTGAIFAALLAPLKSLVLSSSIGPPKTLTGLAKAAQDEVDEVEALLKSIENDQMLARDDLAKVQAAIQAAGAALRKIQETKAETWTGETFGADRTAFSCKVRGECAKGDVGAGTASLPRGILTSVAERLADVMKKFNELPKDNRATVIDQLNRVFTNQATLDENVKTIALSQAALLTAIDTLDALDPTKMDRSTSLVLGPFPAATSRTGTIKISAQDIVSKVVTPLGTVTVNWGGTRWEVSAGALFSNLPARTFQSTPIIVNGKPVLDAGGKITTRVAETQTKPTVVPAALIHYRLLEGVVGGQRLALLATAALGINIQSGSADIGYGGTVCYRGLMVSLLVHNTRDLRLTNGLEPGQELGSAPPTLTTERYWTKASAIAVSYRAFF